MTQLKDQGAAVAAELSALSIRDQGGLGGALHSLLDGPHRHELENKRAALAEQLRATLAALAEKAPATTVPEADALRAEAQASLQEAHAALDRQHAAPEQAQALAGEIQRRQAAAKEMGFDSLYTAAWLEANGPAPIESPLALKPKEQAYVAVPAVLARITTRTRYVDGGQGISFPIGHTGIRYRVGSFSGHPLTTTSMADVDQGTLVLSNQRVAFIGRLKSVVTPLPKIVHVESYSDALAVFQEGRENPTFYKLQTPQYFLLYLNWVLGHQG